MGAKREWIRLNNKIKGKTPRTPKKEFKPDAAKYLREAYRLAEESQMKFATGLGLPSEDLSEWAQKALCSDTDRPLDGCITVKTVGNGKFRVFKKFRRFRDKKVNPRDKEERRRTQFNAITPGHMGSAINTMSMIKWIVSASHECEHNKTVCITCARAIFLKTSDFWFSALIYKTL